MPKNDTGGRKHTSTATVAVLPESTRRQPAAVADSDLQIDRIRGHGRGGQRRNKVETAIRLTHIPTGIVITRLSGRSQAQNIVDAKEELSARLADQAQEAQTSRANLVRRRQTDSERSGKDFTHCWYRDDVVRHVDGRRWTIRQWKQGRM